MPQSATNALREAALEPHAVKKLLSALNLDGGVESDANAKTMLKYLAKKRPDVMPPRRLTDLTLPKSTVDDATEQADPVLPIRAAVTVTHSRRSVLPSIAG